MREVEMVAEEAGEAGRDGRFFTREKKYLEGLRRYLSGHKRLLVKQIP